MNKKIGTLLLTGMTVMSMGTTAFAADATALAPTGTAANPATVSVTKNLEFAEGITIPNTSFGFKAEMKATTPGAPAATIKKIEYSKADSKGDLKNGKYTVSKDSKIVFGDFPHAGLYEYTVTEENGGLEGMSYSTKSYTLKVYVANGDDGKLFVKNIVAHDDENGQKPDKVLFTNTYTKNGGSEDNKDSLVIKKETKGELADKTKKFKFKLVFVKAATTNNNDELIGKIGDKEVKFSYSTEKEFELSDEQTLTFKQIPAGTRYEVTEIGAEDGYKPSVKVVENGTEMPERTAVDKDDLCSAEAGKNNLIGEKENKVTFVNTNDATPATGIFTKNAPMMVVAGLAALAMLGYASIKRKLVKR